MGVTTTALFTVEQFADLPQEETQGAELVQGEIVRLPRGIPGETSWAQPKHRVVYPRERTLWVHRASGENLQLREGQYIEEPSLLPGFRVLADQFFDGI